MSKIKGANISAFKWQQQKLDQCKKYVERGKDLSLSYGERVDKDVATIGVVRTL